MNIKVISSLLLTASIAFSGAASAAITGPTTLEFTNLPLGAYFGKANLPNNSTGTNCQGGQCIIEDGVFVGVVNETDNADTGAGTGEHLHRDGTSAFSYESDSTGLYFRLQDSTAFKFNSININASINSLNPDQGPNDFWEILGFNTAVNPGLDPSLPTSDGVNYPSRVAYQTFENGFTGTLLLNEDFANVNAVWLHYNDYHMVPQDGKVFNIVMDNIVLNAPVTSAVPVPGALWLFGSGLMGLLSYGRKKTA